MPFGGYENFAACVRANSDKDDPEAYCAAIKQEVENGASEDEAKEEAERMTVGSAASSSGMAMGGHRDTESRLLRVHTLELAHANTRPVQRVEEDGKVRYTNVMLLAPGEWTDAGSRTTLFYAPDAIEKSTANWVDRYGEPVDKAQLNHYHEPGAPASNIGHIPVDSVYGLEGCMYGDLVFHGRTQLSRDMEELMALALETGGEEGLGGVSVEIPADDTVWDEERELYRMAEMWFSGVGVVMDPASVDVAFRTQLEGRVALSSGEDRVEVFTRTRTARDVKADGLRSSAMDDKLLARLEALEQRVLAAPYDDDEVDEDELDPEDVEGEGEGEELADEEGMDEPTVPDEAPEGDEVPEDPAEETEEDVPEDVALAAAALKEYMASLEGVENPDMSVKAFMAWAESVDEVKDEVRGAVSMFLSETEADEDVPVTALKEYMEDKVNPDSATPVGDEEFDLAAYTETTERLLATIDALTDKVEALEGEESSARTLARGGAHRSDAKPGEGRKSAPDVSYGRSTVRDRTGYIGR